MLALPRTDGRKSRRPWGDAGVDTWSPNKIMSGSHANISPDALSNTPQVVDTGREKLGLRSTRQVVVPGHPMLSTARGQMLRKTLARLGLGKRNSGRNNRFSGGLDLRFKGTPVIVGAGGGMKKGGGVVQT